jgi:uncharacterized protein YkwD
VDEARTADPMNVISRSVSRGTLPALIALALLAPATASAATCEHADLMADQAGVEQLHDATLCLLNNERRSRRLKALKSSPQLRKAAENHSRSMVQNTFFDHVSPSGSTLLSRVRRLTGYLRGARSYALGENIAWGTGEYSSPRQTVRNWMNSPGHRRNILNRRFRHVGIGVALGAPEDAQGMPAATYTTDFGFRAGG